jgi:hypothetical protein
VGIDGPPLVERADVGERTSAVCHRREVRSVQTGARAARYDDGEPGGGGSEDG